MKTKLNEFLNNLTMYVIYKKSFVFQLIIKEGVFKKRRKKKKGGYIRDDDQTG